MGPGYHAPVRPHAHALVCAASLFARVAVAAVAPHPSDPAAVLAMVLGDDGGQALRVRNEVEARGFYSGAPLGVGACAKCHPDVTAQFAASAHRFASFSDPYYAFAVGALREERGSPAARFCGNCHDPLPVAQGTLERPGPFDNATPEAQAGLACLICHSIDTPPDIRGNGAYVLSTQPVPLKAGPAHDRRLKPPTLATAEFCATCHKVGLTEAVTGDAWLRGQDEYDAWRDSAWSGRGAMAAYRPPETRDCAGCHMPLEPAVLGDRAAHDGQVRSHRFVGANTALPALRGDTDHLRRTVEFLTGAVTVDLQSAGPGLVDVVLRNVRAGHTFPGGTADSNQVWLEVSAVDASGRLLAWNRDDPHFVRSQPVDAEGRPLRRRDVQHAAGVVFDTSLPPGDPRIVRFTLVPGAARVRARLLYRKFSDEYARFSCVSIPNAALRTACEAPPVTVVGVGEAPVSDGLVQGATAPAARVAWGLALTQGLSDTAGAARAPLEAVAAGDDPKLRALAEIGLARLAVDEGRFDDSAAPTDAPLAALWLRAVGEHRAHRDDRALAPALALLARVPDDRNALGLAARLQGLNGDAAGALKTAEALLVVDPENEEGLLQRMLALRALGRPATDVDAATTLYLRHRRPVDRELQLRQMSRISEHEAVPLHTHRLQNAQKDLP